jgi:POT family proton-dependent oligopeptide transporter
MQDMARAEGTRRLADLKDDGRPLMGHPRGLFYLAFTEAWERFSYFGMIALLALYMVDALLLPGHAAHVAGLSSLRAGLEQHTGALSPQAFASWIFGLYTGFVYFTPLLGGAVADRWLGHRNAVIIGALSMAAGHLAMAFDATFLFALLLLIIGSGLLKGNIASQVGALYPADAESARTRGFTLFAVGINVGAVLGPLLCGFLAQHYGWHYGFGVAALFMLLGLATYLRGLRYLPARVERSNSAPHPLTPADWRTIAALLGTITITIFSSIGYYQSFNVNPIWIEQHVDLRVGGFDIPVPWFQSFDSVCCIAGVPPLIWLWRRGALRGQEPDDIARIGVGAWLTAGSNLVLVAGILIGGNGRIGLIWPLLYSAGLGISWLYYWPVLLALVSQAAPARVNATMLGVVYLSLFVAGLVYGPLGALYESLGPAAFWGLHAAIAAVGGVLVALFGRRLARALEPVRG